MRCRETVTAQRLDPGLHTELYMRCYIAYFAGDARYRRYTLSETLNRPPREAPQQDVVSNMSDAQEGVPEFHVDWDAFNKHLENIMGVPPRVELPKSPELHVDLWRAEAAEAARKDIEKIQQARRRLISGLNNVDVELFERDLFRIPAPKALLVRESADAVVRAKEYLSFVISEGPIVEQRSREYAEAVSQAWAAKSAADAAAFKEQAKYLVTDVAVARARLNELSHVRRALEQEQQANPSEQRTFEISHILSLIQNPI